MGLDRQRTLQPAAVGIDRVHVVAGCEPELLAVEGDAVHVGLVVEGSVFADDVGRCRFHMCILGNAGRGGE